MVKRGWDAHVLGKAPHYFKDAKTAVTTLRVSPIGGREGRRGSARNPQHSCRGDWEARYQGGGQRSQRQALRKTHPSGRR